MGKCKTIKYLPYVFVKSMLNVKKNYLAFENLFPVFKNDYLYHAHQHL